ncbi:reverse transcriptase domain-containing protein [Tanacetum coccineum]
MAKWIFELGAFDNNYRLRTSIHGQILADFIAERSNKDGPPIEIPFLEPWILFTDGSSCLEGLGARLILTNPEGMEFTYALRFEFETFNNEVDNEFLVAGLRIAKQMGVKNLATKVYSLLVANQINGSYVEKEQSIIKRPKHLSTASRSSPLNSRTTYVREKEKFEIHEGLAYQGRSYLKTESSSEITHSKTGVIKSISNKDLHPLSTPNQRIGRKGEPSLGKGIKAQLDKGSKNWIEEVPHVLWAHRTMIKTSNGDTPFSLTYGKEVVIPVEIGMPSLRCTEID